METKVSKELDYSGEQIYIGIDVHKRSWKVCILIDEIEHKVFTQPPESELLAKYVKKHFPGADYHCVYESGFSGFWAQHQLETLGLNCMVVHSADVPTMDREKRRKSDVIDCRKLARALRTKQIRGIYIPSSDEEEDRILVRTRKKMVGNVARCKIRIKAMLAYNGITIPSTYQSSSMWSNRFVSWLRTIRFDNESGTIGLQALVDEHEYLRKLIERLTRAIRKRSKTEKYDQRTRLLMSIPGIGMISAMTILTEMGDLRRFNYNLDKVCGFVGLVPNIYASGCSEKVLGMTRRGNGAVKSVLIEASWIAVAKDPVLMKKFIQLKTTMVPNKAIVRITRKLISRMIFVLKNQQPYQIGIAG